MLRRVYQTRRRNRYPRRAASGAGAAMTVSLAFLDFLLFAFG